MASVITRHKRKEIKEEKTITKVTSQPSMGRVFVPKADRSPSLMQLILATPVLIMIIWIVCSSEVLSLEPQYWLIFTNSYGNDSWTEQLLNYPGCQGIFYLYEWFSTWTAKNEPEEADQDSEFASPLRLALPFSSGTLSLKVNQITLRINAKFECLVYSGCYVAYKFVLCHGSQNYVQSNLSLWRNIVVIYTWVRDVRPRTTWKSIESRFVMLVIFETLWQW